jgi:hypothetical protein
MQKKYYTTVRASEGFWENLIAKQIDKEESLAISNIEKNEMIFTSTGKSVLDEIVNMSKEYPDEIFKVKIEGDDVYNNYIYLYECSRGLSNLIKEGYEYYFGIEKSLRKRIDPIELDRFEFRVVDYYQKHDRLQPNDVKTNLNFDNQSIYFQNSSWSIILEYKTRDFSLTATKESLTYIKVEVKFPDYKELPF